MRKDDGQKSAQFNFPNCAELRENGAQFKNRPKGRGNCARARKSPSLNSGELRKRNPSTWFEVDDERIAELELDVRQVGVAIADFSKEQAAVQAELAPWYALQREVTQEHQRQVQENGFKLGGCQAAYRQTVIRQLDDLRSSLAEKFKTAAEISSRLRSLKNQLRGIETEIKIVKAKQKRVR